MEGMKWGRKGRKMEWGNEEKMKEGLKKERKRGKEVLLEICKQY